MTTITVKDEDGNDVECWEEPDPIRVAALDAAVLTDTGARAEAIIELARKFEDYLIKG